MQYIEQYQFFDNFIFRQLDLDRHAYDGISRRDFIDSFAESLSKFDEVLLLDIYPARELPIEGVTAQWLLSKIKNPNKELILKSELLQKINTSQAEVVLTIGAGDIGEEVKYIKEALTSES